MTPADPEAVAEVQAWIERERAALAAGEAPSAAGAGRHSTESSDGSCATCAELKARYAEHDAWLASLQQSAEAVVAANQQAQALANAQLGGRPTDTPGDTYAV